MFLPIHFFLFLLLSTPIYGHHPTSDTWSRIVDQYLVRVLREIMDILFVEVRRQQLCPQRLHVSELKK